MRQQIQYYFDLVFTLTEKELKVRYKRSILGYVWSVLNPLLFTIVLYFAFKIVVKVPISNYILFLITGLFPWHWFTNSVSAAPTIFLANVSIIKKVNFPRFLLPMAAVLNDLLHFLFSIPVIVMFCLFYNKWPSVLWPIFILMNALVQFILIYGIVLALSTLNLFFRDLEKLISILIMMLFYFTPIFYDDSLVPNKYKIFLLLNPMYSIIDNWRNIFIRSELDFLLYFHSLVYGIVVLIGGVLIFKHLSWKFAEVL